MNEPERGSDRLERIGDRRNGGGLRLELRERTTNRPERVLGVRRDLGALGAFDLMERPHRLRDRLGDVHDLGGDVGIGLEGGEAPGERFAGGT
ncbi:MAG: hypothetical protein U0183_22550 [Polyangiaceae bacterium]